MMNYIIFGGNGFIGTHLKQLIQEMYPDADIWLLDIAFPGGNVPVTGKCPGKVRHIRCDVRCPIGELPFIPAPGDVIFNFAAVHRTPGHPDYAYYETNILGAENICAFAEKYGVRNIVFTSSIASYGSSEEMKHEGTLPVPNTPYGVSKLVAEKIHLSWYAGEQERKLTILRPGVVFGKGENGNFTRLYRGLRKRTFAYPGRKDTIKACIYVKELVRFIMWNVEERKSKMEMFNCSFFPAFSIQQIVDAIKKVTGMKGYVPFAPNAVIMPFAAAAKLIGSPMGICPERVKKLQVSTNICAKKMSDCGYRFKWTLEEALEDWFRDNGFLYLQ